MRLEVPLWGGLEVLPVPQGASMGTRVPSPPLLPTKLQAWKLARVVQLSASRQADAEFLNACRPVAWAFAAQESCQKKPDPKMALR